MSAVLQENTEIFREPGQSYLSPSKFAQVMGLDMGVLADALGVHRNTMRLHPESRRTQERLSDFNRVFLALLELQSDPVRAAFQMKNTPIRVLNQRTLFQAVKDGDVEPALRYLQTVCAGQNG